MTPSPPRAAAASRIVALGSAFPEQVLSNHDIALRVDTSDAWIRERTGIEQRRMLAPGQNNSDIAAAAARDALDRAGLPPSAVDLIITCTNTPDRWLPSLGAAVQAKLGVRAGVPAYDLVTACAGWLAGVQAADALVRTGAYRHVLVIGSEALTRYVDWTDRNTCILFGDGAGACLIGPVDSALGSAAAEPRGRILGLHLHTDGHFGDVMSLPAGGTRQPASLEAVAQRLHLIHMDGLEVFNHAVRCMVEVSRELLAAQGLAVADVDWFVPHQANLRIIQAVARRLGLPMERVALNLHKYGNTSTATIPTCLDEYTQDGRIQPGHTVLMTAFGGGLTWAAGLLRW
ncbi:MAG: beta-ketoacyl-ACP synthase III [Rubrivivax sp.]|nr:beta-ketoacyl-ACP synthase III [Rubrivivax sp.]MDP3222165.1 beta-ketoacyl-ACP synthase III [Rubrivivax sp.]MDP3613416.1 beta-ketoacyl-ACP synthase III [Rubrivivax sp.]